MRLQAHLAAPDDYAGVRSRLDAILQRCQHMQERLGSSITASGGGSRSVSAHTPNWLTARSALLFQGPAAPQQQQAAVAALSPGLACGPGAW